MLEELMDSEAAPAAKKGEESDLGERELAKVKDLVSQLQPLADKAGCSVSELVEKYGSGDVVEEDDEENNEGDKVDNDGGGKLAMIVARMKAKRGAAEE